MKVKLYNGGAGMLPGMGALSPVPAPVLSRIDLSDVPLDLSGMSEKVAAEVRRRYGILKSVKRLRGKGLSLESALEESGESRATYFEWSSRLRRAHGNPRSLAPRSRARKTPPEKKAWTPLAEKFVMESRNKFMVNASDLEYAFALNYPDHPHVSRRTMGRIVATLRDEKALICGAERGKKMRKGKKKQINEEIWGQRLTEKRALWETGHFEVDHMVVKPSAKCCEARVFGAKDKVSGMLYGMAFSSAKALDGKVFLRHLVSSCLGDFKSVQSDNGSEFKKDFTGYLKEMKIPHWRIPPGCPTWNHMIESAYNMLRIRCINFGFDRVESIAELNAKLEAVIFVHNHTPKDYLPIAPPELGLPKGCHLTPYQCHCLINGITPDVVIPFGPKSETD